MREELIRVVRNGRMLCEMFWRREERIGSREQVVALLDVTSVKTSSEKRGLKQLKPSEERDGGGDF